MEFMTVGEAKYLYQHHEHASFILCMQDQRSRKEDDAERAHSDLAEYYAKLLKWSGVNELCFSDKVWGEVRRLCAKTQFDLYQERQKTGDRP